MLPKSIIVAKEKHDEKGFHYHVGILNSTARQSVYDDKKAQRSV